MDSVSDMNIRQLQEALADGKHPMHEEAKRFNAEIAASLAPTLQNIRGNLDLNAAFKPLLGSLEAAKKAFEPWTEKNAKLFKGMSEDEDVLAKLRKPNSGGMLNPGPAPIELVDPLPAVTAEHLEQIEAGMRERHQAQIERDEAFLQAFQAMQAQLIHMATQDAETSKKSGYFSWAALIVGGLTLGATVLFGVLSQSS